MRALACAAFVTALAVSGCASSHAAQPHSSTDAIQLHELGYDQLPLERQSFICSMIRDSPNGDLTEIDVYGPGTRAALVKASSGDDVYPTGRQATKPFYLVVSHGHFVCGECSRPLGATSPEGTTETHVWTRGAGSLDFGIGDNLPAAVSLLNRLAVIQLS
jgi:hypothetical protein